MIAVLWMITEENSMMDPGLKQAGEKHYISIINGKEALDKFKVKPEHYPKNLNSHKKSFNPCNHLFDREKQDFHLAEFLY
jgi:hypothetical protein